MSVPQILYQGSVRIIEVQFYFHAIVAGNQETLTLCSLYSLADEEIIRQTYGAFHVFEYYGEDNLVVVQATNILSVVAMAPFSEPTPRPRPRFYLAEYFALGVVDTGIILE